MDFFDNAYTFANHSSNVTCCKQDNTFEMQLNATCGQGVSCAGQCSALGAMLCPSGDCTNYPKTCKHYFESAEDERSGRLSSATLADRDLAFCTSDGCRVRTNKKCCFNPNCLKWKGRKEACVWLDYLTGIEWQTYETYENIWLLMATSQAKHAHTLESCPMAIGPVRCRRFRSKAPPSWMRMHGHTRVSADASLHMT